MERNFVAKVDAGEEGSKRTLRGYPAHGQQARNNADTAKRMQPFFTALVRKHSENPTAALQAVHAVGKGGGSVGIPGGGASPSPPPAAGGAGGAAAAPKQPAGGAAKGKR